MTGNSAAAAGKAEGLGQRGVPASAPRARRPTRARSSTGSRSSSPPPLPGTNPSRATRSKAKTSPIMRRAWCARRRARADTRVHMFAGCLLELRDRGSCTEHTVASDTRMARQHKSHPAIGELAVQTSPLQTLHDIVSDRRLPGRRVHIQRIGQKLVHLCKHVTIKVVLAPQATKTA